ncbi:aspartyl-phosphate phosphatase Spo0E family protein [Niallia sp. 03133]|uniref:aspartyl-phosphate phosphatase Spo0E family protein n=1 Tax=Niallia sp. 03133 TaxID=3458060 RepID=UPI004044410B
MSEKNLLQNIEEHREKMVYLANLTSFSHPRVIDISIKLDQLLNKYDSFLRSKCNQTNRVKI